MNTSLKQTLRVVLGFFLGLVGGMIAGVCLLILAVLICNADGGDFAHEPKHAWVGALTTVVGFVSPYVAPLGGILLGIIWAIRRNRRDAPTIA